MLCTCFIRARFIAHAYFAGGGFRRTRWNDECDKVEPDYTTVVLFLGTKLPTSYTGFVCVSDYVSDKHSNKSTDTPHLKHRLTCIVPPGIKTAITSDRINYFPIAGLDISWIIAVVWNGNNSWDELPHF